MYVFFHLTSFDPQGSIGGGSYGTLNLLAKTKRAAMLTALENKYCLITVFF